MAGVRRAAKLPSPFRQKFRYSSNSRIVMDRNTKQIIVFLERNTFSIPFRKPAFEHEWVEFGETTPDEVAERLAQATIAICNKVSLRAEALSQLPNLRLIAVAATGVDNVDLAFCRNHNIAVCNTRGYAVNSLPEHALT